MCFRPPTVEMKDNNCPACGAELFIGATKCNKCGAAVNTGGPVGVASVPPKGAPGSKEFPGAPGAPKAPAAPGVPKAPAGI